MNLAALLPSPAPDRPAIVAAAVVLRAPSSEADTIDVQWVAPADETIGEEPGTERDVRWVCRPGAAPAVDDAALLVLDSYGDPWAVVDGSGPDLSAGLSALDARLDALEAAAAKTVRGQATIVGTGSVAAQVEITDDLGTTNKKAVGTFHIAGSTYVADAVVVYLTATTTNTTTLRVLTRGGGAIGVGDTVLVDYMIWRD